MKRIISFALALMLCLSLSVIVFVSADAPLVTDDANLLSSGEKAALESRLQQVSDEYGAQIAVATTASAEGYNMDSLVEYIYDMAGAMNGADLVICRAGASTMAEVCACGKPALIVPSPYVADNHQEKNARALERAGAAVVALEKEVDGKALFEQVKAMLADREGLAAMRDNARKMASLDALDRIYAAICETVGKA